MAETTSTETQLHLPFEAVDKLTILIEKMDELFRRLGDIADVVEAVDQRLQEIEEQRHRNY